MWAWILGVAGTATVGLILWWMVHLGKRIAEGEQFGKRNIELVKQAKEKNQFIKDVDRISKGKDALKKKARAAFRRGSVAELVRVLDESREDTTSEETTATTKLRIK